MAAKVGRSAGLASQHRSISHTYCCSTAGGSASGPGSSSGGGTGSRAPPSTMRASCGHFRGMGAVTTGRAASEKGPGRL